MRRVTTGILLAAIAAWGAAAQDTMSDTWAAADALGRALPDERQAPAARADRFVGVFYYIWHGAHGYERNVVPVGEAQDVHVPGPGNTRSPFNISTIIQAPAGQREWGPRHAFHHWGEPLFGYYVANDEWVIRKHAQMLADAGVDVIVFDVTNGFHYRAVYMNILRVYADIRAKGGRTPAVAFLTNSGHARVARHLYDDLYAKGLYKDLWFMWKGKPLLMADPEGLGDDLAAFFTLRRSWAWTTGQKWFGDGRDRWPWLDHTPQQPGWHEAPGKPEQIVVCAAEHPDSDRGKSFHGGANPKPHRSEQGLYFEEQWRRALEVDPEFVFITQWNEWMAMRFTRKDVNRPSYAGEADYDPEGVFVDVYDAEYNRDIEPMKDGYGDNYYYQMWQGIRRFKGVRPLQPASARVPDDWAGAGDLWDAVGPAYWDDAGDTFHRDHFGYGSVGALTNRTGRNDIRLCKVARSPSTVWFMAETAQPLTPPDGEAWMALDVRVEGGGAFEIRPRPDGKKAEIRAVQPGAPARPLGEAPCSVEGRRFIVAVPRATLGVPDGAMRLRFKWSDNVIGERPLAWWTDGDTAPNGRAEYRFEAVD